MADIAKLVEDLSQLTVMEAAELAKALEEAWGGIDGYLRDGLCVTDDELARFRATMLEPA